METGKGKRSSSSARQTYGSRDCACSRFIPSKSYILILLFLLFPVLFFPLELPESFKILEEADHAFLFRYNTPISVAESKEQLLDFLENHGEIIDFWKASPSIILEYTGPEDFRDDVLSVVQNLGVSVGHGKKLYLRLKLYDNYVLIDLSYDSLSLNNYSSLSRFENWKEDLEKLIRKIINIPNVEVPHVALVKTFGNTVKYKGEIKNNDFLIFSYSKNIELEILENRNWKKLMFKLKNPADIIRLNYFDVEFQTIPNHAKLFVDNNYIGETPLTVKLKSGIHSIRVEHPGYEFLDEKIYVDKEQILKYVLDKPVEGTLSLNLNVLEATVTVDSRTYKVKDGKLSIALEPGTHDLRVYSKNRESLYEKIHINPDETKKINVKLKGIVGEEDWTIFVDVEKVKDVFILGYNELAIWQNDGSLICIDALKKELLWNFGNFEDVLDVYRYNESYLVVCKDSLQLIRKGKDSLLIKLENECFVSWDFKSLTFATNSGKIYKLSDRTFQVLWVRKEYPLLSILSGDDSIVMFDVFRNIHCYNIHTMMPIWRSRFKNVVSIFQNGSKLYLLTGKSVIVLDLKTGKKLEKVDFGIEVKNILFLDQQVFVIVGNVLKSLNGKEVINYQGRIYSDEKNIYILNGENLRIYFMDKDRLNLKVIALSGRVKKAKAGNGIVILIYESGKISKVFGNDGY